MLGVGVGWAWFGVAWFSWLSLVLVVFGLVGAQSPNGFGCKIFWLCLVLVLVGLGLVWSGCLVEFGFGCDWFGLGPSPSKGLHYCVPWCGVLIHVACCVACRGRAVVVGVGVGVGCVWFGAVWLLGWVWFGFGCGLRQGNKEQNTNKV